MSEVRDGLQAVLARAVARFCPPSLRHLRDDLVQSAWIRVLEAQRRGDPDRTFSSSYLYKVAYSALIDELRRLRRRGEVALDDAPEEQAVEPRRSSPAQQAEGYALARGLQDCLLGVSEDRRLAVSLFLQGHTVPEAAELLGVSRPTLYDLMHRLSLK